MSCEESAKFCSILLYTLHIRQNPSTFLPTSTKRFKKVISTDIPALRPVPNVFTTFLKQKMKLGSVAGRHSSRVSYED